MAKSSADDAELRRACAAAVAASGARGEEVTFSIRVAKGRGIFEKLGRLAKPRVLALTCQSLPLLPRTACCVALAYCRCFDFAASCCGVGLVLAGAASRGLARC
jgi:hypothetical protein